MTGLIPSALLFAAVGLLAPRGAMVLSGVPNPATSDKPTYISLGGMNGQGVPDPFVTVTYVMRDANFTPLAYIAVVLNFAGCTDIVLSPGTGVNCGAKTFSGTTDGFGRLSITLAGHGNGSGPARPVCDCVTVTAGAGQPFPSIGVSTFDRDGVNGVGASDLALLIRVFVLDQSPLSSTYPS